MSPAQNQKEHSPPEPEYDATDGGWDPYITALLTGALQRPGARDEDDDRVPVMSFSRTPRKASRDR